MKPRNYKNKKKLKSIVTEYEAMFEQGTVCFFEETVFLDIADYYENKNMIDEALNAISHAIEQNSFSAALLIRKAELLLIKNCIPTAMDYLDKAELFFPNDQTIKIMKIEVMVEQGHLSKSLILIKEMEEDMDRRYTARLFYLKSLVYEAKRNYGKMFRSLNKAVMVDPDNELILKKLWLGVELTGKFEESVDIHNMVIDHNPFSATAWYNLGHAHLKLEEYCEAEEAFEYAFLIEEDFEDAYRDCAEVRIRMKDYEGALDCYEEMLTLFNPDSALFVNIGYCYECMDKYDLAQVCYEKSFKYSRENDWAYFRKGSCLLKTGKTEQAIIFLEKANLMEKNSEVYINELAKAYCRNGEDKKANDLYYKATGAAPDLCSVWINYVKFLLAKGKVKGALELIEEAEIYAMGVELVYCKAACLIVADKRTKGNLVLRQALRQKYDTHYCLFSIYPQLKDDVDVLLEISTFQL
ncbi:MAG: tetratricopeptide repeat protein [Saprospiraceae bacterium]